MEFKTTGIVKDVDITKRVVTGFFTSTGTLDSDNDIFIEGAFKKTIAEMGPTGKNRIWHLWQHDTDKPLNKPYLLEERKEGVYFETKMINTPFAEMALALYEEQAISEHSVAIFPLKDDIDTKSGARLLKEVRMLEGSSVLWGANENTPFAGFKAEQATRQMEALEKLLRSGAFKQDEIYELIELKIAQIKQALEPVKPLEPQNADGAGATTPKQRGDFHKLTIELN
jgi:HK97 family phage prohead protease